MFEWAYARPRDLYKMALNARRVNPAEEIWMQCEFFATEVFERAYEQ